MREGALRALAAAEQAGEVDHATAERYRHDLAALGDDFFSGLALITGVESIAGGEQAPGRPGFELVPPPVCRCGSPAKPAARGFRCHDLASSRNVAVGTPLYQLRSSPGWVTVPKKSRGPIDLNRLFRAVLSRDLTPAEGQLLMDFLFLTGAAKSTPARFT